MLDNGFPSGLEYSEDEKIAINNAHHLVYNQIIKRYKRKPSRGWNILHARQIALHFATSW